MEDLRPQILDFVANRMGSAPERLAPEVSLFDLGLDGDDALDFFEVFAERLSVDLAALDLGRHFGPEGAFNPFSLFADAFRRRRCEPVYVRDLIAAAERHRW